MSCSVNCPLVWNRQLLACLSLTSTVPLIPFTVAACLLVSLSACLPPCQPALPARFTTSKPGTVRWGDMLKPIPAACCSSQHCEMASACRPLQSHLLRRQDYAWITSRHNHTVCITVRAGQPLNAGFLCTALQPGVGVLDNGHGHKEKTVKPNVKACSLSVCGWAVQGHWFTTLSGPLRGWRATQSTCTIGRRGLCMIAQCPSPSSPQTWDQPTLLETTPHYQRPGNWQTHVNIENNLPNAR